MLVPESMKANSLFRKMQENREYFAVVIDEYGGMSGIVTLHDIMEALLGDLSEKESPIKPEEIEKLSEDKFVIQGSADLEDVAEALDIEMPIDVYDTFSGFICGVLGRIPEEGEKFKCQWEDWTITAHNVKHHIVESATIERVKEQE